MEQEVPKMDVVLMRSKSGSQILDIDFGSAEQMMNGAAQCATQCSQPPPTQTGPPIPPQNTHPVYANGQVPGAYVPVTAPGVMSVYNTQHLQAMPQQHMPPQITTMPSGQGPMSLRKLKIIEHHVHRIDTHTKDNGEPEEELVVSNLRHFTLKVAVVDANDVPILDTELPLQATLLYENGLPVKQLSNSEPLLVGEPEVVALQGSAVFKLRITSLSSHRDKQRFRIQIAPQNPLARQQEPALTIVTDPMKSVTKLAHRSNAKDLQGAGTPGTPLPKPDAGSGGVVDAAVYSQQFESVNSQLKQHGEQIGQLQEMHGLILKQLQDLNALVRGLVSGPAGQALLGSAPQSQAQPQVENGAREDESDEKAQEQAQTPHQ